MGKRKQRQERELEARGGQEEAKAGKRARSQRWARGSKGRKESWEPEVGKRKQRQERELGARGGQEEAKVV